MSKKVYYLILLVAFVGVIGLVGAQMTGTKPTTGAVVSEKETPKEVILEQRVIELAKNQDKILSELAEIKKTQTQILQMTEKIFTRMARRK